MLTAAEFYSKRCTIEREKRLLEGRIERMAQYDEKGLLDEEGIISPFVSDYEISPATRLWLEEYGWKEEDGHIKAIEENERYIP